MSTLTATGGVYDAGIEVNAGSTVTIHGGKVTATGEYGAGIGGYNKKAGGSINILGGTVAASSQLGAGIGGGWQGAGGEITISGGMVMDTSQSYGAGIGGGQLGSGGKITITGGEVTATSNGKGAGIGGGNDGAGGEITITGGTVEATSSSGAGIGGDGNGGDFTADGNAFIVATGGGSAAAISDQNNSDSWSGVIFEGSSGKVYGSEITLAADAEIPAGKELEIGEGQTLIVGADVKLTNNGTITGSGTIKGKVIGSGTIEDGITVQDHTHQWDTAWSSDATNHWRRCTVTGCGERSDTAAHTPGDWIVDQAATSTDAGSRHKACTVCGYVTATETIPATGGDGGGYIPPVTPTYPPTVEQPSEGGEAPVTSPANPKRGDTVTVMPRPDEGYEVEKITVTDRNGKPVEVTKRPDGTYTFTQPTGKVKIEVTYKPVQPVETPWNNPFPDVSEGDWYYEAVRFVQERGLMNGYEDGRFGPNDTLSRAQLAQILFNKEGRPVVDYLLTFPDVTGEAWYAEAIRWAASQGIVGGYGNGRFGPNDNITREQLAVMLWRYSGSPAATNKELYFNDTDEISPFALEAMRWAMENGIVNGSGDGRLGPQGQATRAQVAQMLKNFIENQESK